MNKLERALAAESDKLLACIHCGLCLSSCPTYLQLGDENDSPRGRLYLMRAVAEGRLQPTAEAFLQHTDLCLGCRACESVCPSGVRYGHLLESARAELAVTKGRRKSFAEGLVRWALNHVFVSPQRLRLLFAPARALRRSETLKIILESNMLPEQATKALGLLLSTEQTNRKQQWATNGESEVGRVGESYQPGPKRQVAFFAGCVARELFDHVNQATIQTLTANHCDVLDPKDQVCCGALHAHAGEIETARQMARKNISVFEAIGDGAIVVNVAGCGALMKEYGELLADDPEYSERAKRFASRVRDISEYLIEIGFQPGDQPVRAKVTYDAPCHLHHAQRVTTAPIEVIRRLPGVTFVPLAEAEMCCGSAGVYNLIHPEMADELLKRKLENIKKTGAEILLTGNAGCLMHLASGIREAQLDMHVMHPVELVALTYRGTD